MSLRGMGRFTVLTCGLLLAMFAAAAWAAVRGESPTADEPYHALAAYLHRWDDDFRFDAEDPPLWQEYAALASSRTEIRSDFQQQDWTGVPMNTPPEFQWILRTMYRTPGDDVDTFLARQRAMMLGLGVLLGGLIAGYAWRWMPSGVPPPARAVAAIAACMLFCFDPNFLAHSPLVKNDVVCSLAMLGVVSAVHALGRRITPWRVLHVGLWCGVALAVKFTGLLLVGIAAVLLIVRAMLPTDWPTGSGTVLRSRPGRLRRSVGALLLVGLIAWAVLWASYGFRFLPSRDPHFSMDLPTAVRRCVERTWQAARTDGVTIPEPAAAALATAPVPIAARVTLWLDTHHLFPQAWLAGFLYTYQSALLRGEFLDGRLGCAGWWWYFPFAMLVKTPLDTLTAMGVASVLAVTVAIGRFRRAVRPTDGDPHTLWTATCLLVPLTLYLSAAMRTNLNLGLRHVFPIYPLLFVGTGLMFGVAWSRRAMWLRVVGPVLAIGLAVESFCAFPNDLAFFNAAAGGSRGGVRLLSDSNLDWGQGLKRLADWQRQHPTVKLYLAYFGQADPAYYGIHAANLDPASPLGPAEKLSTPGVVAISATELQGTYLPQINGHPYFAGLWPYRPFDVLAGSIYLFHFPLTPADRLPGNQMLIGPPLRPGHP